MAILNIPLAIALPAVAGIVLLLTWRLYLVLERRPLNKINGPKGNIFVGNGLSLPPRANQKLREWAQQYGEVYKIRFGWYHWVVLNSPEAIKEVFDKQVNEEPFTAIMLMI